MLYIGQGEDRANAPGARGEKEEMGRNRAVNTPDQWKNTVEAFIQYCEESQCLPTDYELMQFASVSAATLNRYTSAQGNYSKYGAGSEALKKYREHVFLGAALAAKNPAAAVFALKQEKNGGWTDLQTVKQDSTLKIQVAGVGGTEAFK